ncbi:MAG TPA: YebC/PmpR family DNA-binding transcriptional regulator [Sedimentibacter sp.]|jgi:YebC/PmpR family DNA-binding regulatory protein|nr:YebC/PmpR family DNA-binding transcriptional regulator [Tissierellia bacterium]HOA19174.1 YebC/PmpR family DNA-binding transcriptional regulator [Sedimentibacter sp.]HOG62393.1 YebC/PmpR family DNA-binding transcriptional regulator [Sedimentibacter sp.]HPB78557.1 YebC/PmpR family DNA-binding transcriptional regulator [Sedimentibacter sp.]HPY55534.1 YebC/PmpR family DNA-binding transcriptional regulator [Sedimentibacter sp.]
MSGHSKWSNIKNRKGKQDALRGKIFTKLARAITVAAREGGADPDYNSSLATAIEKAKAQNMPNDNIDRAIKAGLAASAGENFETITYEGYGPSGTAFMVQCLTDNKNRTAADIRHYFSKHNGNLGTTGCVSYLFDKKGVISIESDGIDEEELMMAALEAGAEDFEAQDDSYEITTIPEDFIQVLNSLKEAGYENIKGDIMYIPQTYVKVEDEAAIKNLEKLIDALEENDDVQEVYHNWDEPEEEEE